MQEDLASTQLWKTRVKFYEELVSEYDFKFQPMVNLVKNLSSSEYAKVFFPTTSHDKLIISKEPRLYEKWNKVSVVVIGYLPKQGQFTLEYWNKDKKESEQTCTEDDIFSKAEALLLRLNLQA